MMSIIIPVNASYVALIMGIIYLVVEVYTGDIFDIQDAAEAYGKGLGLSSVIIFLFLLYIAKTQGLDILRIGTLEFHINVGIMDILPYLPLLIIAFIAILRS